MSRLTSAFKRFAAPIVVVLVVAAAAVVYLLTIPSTTVNPGIPITGRVGNPVTIPMELQPGYNLSVDQSQYKPKFGIPIPGNPGSQTISNPIELDPGYNLKENPSQFK